MEDIHGVDVSWLHHSNKDRPARTPKHRQPDLPTTSPGLPTDLPPPKSQSHLEHKEEQQHAHAANIGTPRSGPPVPHGAAVAPQPQVTTTPASGTPSKRPSLLNRHSSVGKDETKTRGRKSSWISSLSSKLSSSSGASTPTQTTPQAQAGAQNSKAGATPMPASEKSQDQGYFSGNTSRTASGASTPTEESEPYTPTQRSGGSSFFSNALRRLSSGTQVNGLKPTTTNSTVPRRILNIDPNRPRCLVPDLDVNKLRRVAFCVDVEIAGGPKYKEEQDDGEKKKKTKEKKALEKNEGDALKHPKALAEEADAAEAPALTNLDPPQEEADPRTSTNSLDGDKKDGSRKKEKKKKSEEERKQRQANKRRKAEADGSVPIELTRESSSDSLPSLTDAPVEPKTHRPSNSKSQSDRPTIDPLRMYRRCCQLRETPILKRITEQLGDPKRCPAATPGVVSLLDLTGSRLQLQDLVTLGDWLAIVPVRKLIMEDADLTDEGLRSVLAGLLAAMRPDQPRHRRHRLSNGEAEKYEERSGIIEKLSLKNNSRIAKEGWKHISLFIYMCGSLRALDLSMLSFPRTGAPANQSATASGSSISMQDTAEVFSKALSERFGGDKLEELIMGECNLSTPAVQRIIDGVSMSGLKRLGLAGNNLDDAGVAAVARYMKSGLCQGLDLGGNDMTESRVTTLADAMHKDAKLWALSLADCNLTTEAVRPLFPGILALPNLRFLDLSHNHALFEANPSAIHALRKYLPQLPILKRFHLTNCNLSPAQAIALVEILPECQQLAHVNILANPQIAALASATTEEAQEEACALYASLMVAVRCSRTILAIDVDVPSAQNSEVVKALAKQIIAYCLRNMQYVTELENPDKIEAVEKVRAEFPKPKNADLPEVLLHLVGHIDEQDDPHPEVPAPDNDYIVGGTGVVKALNYMLKEKAAEIHQEIASGGVEAGTSPGKSVSGPRDLSVAPHEVAAKAKMMSTNLLDSARKIRQTLYPAMVKEAKAGDDMAYRRLLFLDNTLQNIIQRFEDEFPETRIPPSNQHSLAAQNAMRSDNASFYIDKLKAKGTPITNPGDTIETQASEEARLPDSPPGGFSSDEGENETGVVRPRLRSRHNSDVSLASRALSTEEGQMHRLGQRVRQKLDKFSSPDGSVPGSPVQRPLSSRGLAVQSPTTLDGNQSHNTDPSSTYHTASESEDPFTLPSRGSAPSTSNSAFQSYGNQGTIDVSAHRMMMAAQEHESEPEELKRIYDQLNALESEELRREVKEKGVDEALKGIGLRVRELG